jgi:hypothetical protein
MMLQLQMLFERGDLVSYTPNRGFRPPPPAEFIGIVIQPGHYITDVRWLHDEYTIGSLNEYLTLLSRLK